jgi:hypothetical protein
MFDQLTQREYGHTLKGQLHLETKADMKARGVMSPDIIDALALTYAQQLPPRNVTNAPARPNATNDNSYEPHSEEAFSW